MDYQSLAQQLIDLRASREHISFDREISKVMKGELFILNYLYNHGSKAHPRELSREMLVSTARTAVILRNLEKEHLIERIPDENGNRQVFVVLSDKGTKLLEERHQKAVEYVVDILKRLGEKDAEEYVRIQKKLMNSVLVKTN